jgi:putative ABC transport system permease protein
MLVRRAVPVSIGDNVAGLRIVGTSPAYGEIYDAQLASGRWWTAPMEAVIGAAANRQLKLRPGDVFIGDHGLAPGGEAHRDTPYRVVGILRPTGAVIDRVVLTDTASVWKVHEHENQEHPESLAGGREITALLITYRSAMGALMLPRYITSMPNLQAASPAVETAHLTTLLGTGADVLRAFGLGLLALSAVGFFVALYSAVSQRRGELALLRALGAHPSLLFALVAIEGLLLGLTGSVLGVGLGRAAALFAAQAAARGGGPALPLPPLGAADAAVIAGALALSLLAAVAPGLVAYRTQPAIALRGA